MGSSARERLVAFFALSLSPLSRSSRPSWVHADEFLRCPPDELPRARNCFSKPPERTERMSADTQFGEAVVLGDRAGRKRQLPGLAGVLKVNEQVAYPCVPQAGRFCEAPAHNVCKGAVWHLRFGFQVTLEKLGSTARGERQLPISHLVQHNAERIDVRSLILGRAARDLLRGHVGRGAGNRQSARLPAPKPRLLRFRRRCSGTGNAKISDLQVSRCTDQEIFRLDIAVTNQSPAQGMFEAITEMSGIPRTLLHSPVLSPRPPRAFFLGKTPPRSVARGTVAGERKKSPAEAGLVGGRCMQACRAENHHEQGSGKTTPQRAGGRFRRRIPTGTRSAPTPSE